MESTIAAVGTPRLLVGLNYAWAFNKYGWYFGPKHDESWIADNFYRERTTFVGGPSWPSAFSLTLDEIKSRFGIRLIRLFLLCNAQNLGVVSDASPWRILDPLPPEFCEHLTIILDTLRRKEMKAILSILDFGIGAPFGARQRGHHRVVTDSSVRADFVARVVTPFAKIGRAYHDVIFAWEAMNEPVWLTGHTWPHEYRFFDPAASVAQVNSYLREVIQGIRAVDPDVKTTVGHRYYRDLTVFETGDLPQFHFYPTYVRDPFALTPTGVTVPGTDPPTLPVVRRERVKPILGELGVSSGHGDSWLELRGADHADARCRARERLVRVEESGYEVVLAWPDEDWDGSMSFDRLKYSREAQQGILEYLHRTRTP